MPDDKFKLLHSIEAAGNAGWYGVKILVATKEPIDLQNKELANVAYDAQDNICNEIIALLKVAKPETKIESDNNRTGILGLFDNHIFAKEIPNGYCKKRLLSTYSLV